jgi:tetratricopeptide (TPR) repeat protein
MRSSTAAAILIAWFVITDSAWAQYSTAEEAFRAGRLQLSMRNYAASQEPLEAALRLAPDDEFRLKVYDALFPAYRMLPEPDKFIEASEFVIRKSPSADKRSLTRTSLVSFAQQRGKTGELAQQYEDALKKEQNDRAALFILSYVYAQTQRDPNRAVELLQRLVRLDEKEEKPFDAPQSAELARQYVQAKRYVDGAALFEKLAPMDEKLAAWHWKEAASAWLTAGEKAKALAAAQQSDASKPESRSEQLAHHWHRGLADVFLAAGEPKTAIGHYEKAIEKTNIQGYIDGCKKSLAEAKAKAGA